MACPLHVVLEYGQSWFALLMLCLKRQARLEFTNYPAIGARIILNVATGMLCSSLWPNLPRDANGLSLRYSLIFHVCISSVLAVGGVTAIMFASKEVYHKQRTANLFHTSTYWIAANVFQVRHTRGGADIRTADNHERTPSPHSPRPK